MTGAEEPTIGVIVLFVILRVIIAVGGAFAGVWLMHWMLSRRDK